MAEEAAVGDLEVLLENGVLTSTTEDTISWSEPFEAEVTDRTKTFGGESPPDPAEVVPLPPELSVDRFGELLPIFPAFCATMAGIAERLPESSARELVRRTVVVRQVRLELPPTGGVPDGFLPVERDQLEPLLRLYPRSVTYVWRKDCDPCDLVKEDLEDLFSASDDDVALFSIYGPNNVEYLYQYYDVYGAPVVLFFDDGGVDSRLTGAQHPSALRNELEILLE